MNLELINPLLHYAGALDDLEDILFENEMRAFERELDGHGIEDLSPLEQPVWGASPGILKAKSKKKTRKRKRARVKTQAKTAQTRTKLKVKKTAKKRRPAQARPSSKARS
ncbi:MAG: hypothetical protein P1V97_33745 [Planctomycetota bacterium]|nr:hypothetical protein [Planctomycetota bacterium]